MTLLTHSTEPWGIYYGVPARRQRERKKDLLELFRRFQARSTPARRAMSPKQSEQSELMRQLAVYGNVGMNFVCAVLVGFALGWLADNELFSGSTTPWLTFIGLALGIAAAFKSLWSLTKEGHNAGD